VSVDIKSRDGRVAICISLVYIQHRARRWAASLEVGPVSRAALGPVGCSFVCIPRVDRETRQWPWWARMVAELVLPLHCHFNYIYGLTVTRVSFGVGMTLRRGSGGARVLGMFTTQSITIDVVGRVEAACPTIAHSKRRRQGRAGKAAAGRAAAAVAAWQSASQ